MTRARLVALACGVVAAGAVYGLWWVSSERTLGFVGTGGGGPIGMRQIASLDAASYDTPDDAPPAFGWHRGAAVFESFLFHNSLSVPITVTGLVGAPQNGSFLSAPRAYMPKPPRTYASTLSELTPLHDLHIGAGADADIAFVWHTRGICSKIATPPHEFESSEIGGVRLAYTVLGVFHEQTWVPMVENLPDDGSEGYLFSVATPHPNTCPAGYPLGR